MGQGFNAKDWDELDTEKEVAKPTPVADKVEDSTVKGDK